MSGSAPEEAIGTVLAGVCTRTFLNVAEPSTDRPYLVFQILPGGRPMVFLNKQRGDKVHLPVQVSAWGDTPESAIQLMRQVEAALLAATTINARPQGNCHTGSDEETGRHSATQDFEIYAPR